MRDRRHHLLRQTCELRIRHSPEGLSEGTRQDGDSLPVGRGPRPSVGVESIDQVASRKHVDDHVHILGLSGEQNLWETSLLSHCEEPLSPQNLRNPAGTGCASYYQDCSRLPLALQQLPARTFWHLSLYRPQLPGLDEHVIAPANRATTDGC